MSQRVVDLFEPVDGDDRQQATDGRAGQVVVERAAVVQPGQGIAVRQLVHQAGVFPLVRQLVAHLTERAQHRQ